MGHFFYPHPIPVTETQKHSAYPGCYALSKVLEEVMLEQYYIQYDLNGCCLRAPWIMEKDDFKYQLSFGEDVFGGPRWRDLVGARRPTATSRRGAVPVMLDPDGKPVKRNFVHVDDLVGGDPAWRSTIRARAKQTFNVCMDEPVDYGELGAYLAKTRGSPRCRSDAVPLDLARQHQGQVPARLAAALRPARADRRGLRLQARAGRSAHHLVPGVSGRGRLP